jgi:3',5'-cyclic AMP phosphodiesterase CpdA
MKIIHLSDLHIGHEDCGERFHTITGNLCSRMLPAEDYIIVITGDITDNGNDPGQREEAASSLRELENRGYRILAVPGNHDYGTGTMGNIKNVKVFKETFFKDPDISYPKTDIINNILFIGLDSTAEELNWHDRIFAQGELGREQLDRLEKILNIPEINSMTKVVYLHHHPFDFKFGRQLKDSEDLKKIISNRINILLFGHYHRSKQSAYKIHHGTWGIPRCYNAGTSTHKNENLGFHRVIDLLSPDNSLDFDGRFL